MEVLMVVLKALTVLIAGILSILTVRHVMREMQAVKVRARQPERPRSHIRLRQDPRTGIYYPEN
jgi:hypothetical protein